MTTWTRRLAAGFAGTAAALALPLVSTANVAHACACGGYIPAENGTATVTEEKALVRFAGDGTEDIYLALTLNSDVSTGALLFPVPDKNATVKAGPKELFAQLELASRSSSDDSTGAPQAAGEGVDRAAPVEVNSRQNIGPLDVATLTTTESGSLQKWLTSNGFATKPALIEQTQVYLDEGWSFMAVRLRPEADTGSGLTGELDPLHVRFKTDEPVYPMRLSERATQTQQVTLYTLTTGPTTLRGPNLPETWQGYLQGSAGYAVREVAEGPTTYLSKWSGYLEPSAITDDFHFAAADPAAPATTGASTTPPTDHLGERAGAVARSNGPWPYLGGAGVLGVAVLIAVGVASARRRQSAARR